MVIGKEESYEEDIDRNISYRKNFRPIKPNPLPHYEMALEVIEGDCLEVALSMINNEGLNPCLVRPFSASL